MNLFVQKDGKKPSAAAAALNVILVCAAVIAVFWVSLSMINVQFDFRFL